MEDYKKAKTSVAIDSKASDELENHLCPNTMDPSFLEDKQSLAFLETSLTMIILRWFCVLVLHRNIFERSSSWVVSVLQGSAGQWQVNSGEKGEKLETFHDNCWKMLWVYLSVVDMWKMFELLDNVMGLLIGYWQVKDVLPQAEICSADLFFTDHQSGEYRLP